ncbi:MAG: transporter substrate-binding domain-containing protein [Desulfobacter sp.]|nr:MAG: transporter substrate-binding domain-containing protein [Desulfobacter sp.]
MKKHLGLIVLVVCLWMPFNTGTADTTITMAIGEWAPFTSQIDPDGKLAEVLVREIYTQEGIKVRYTYFPWKRSFKLTKIGDYAATFPWRKTEERKPDFYFPKEILYKEKEVFFHLKTLDFKWEDDEDLKNYTIGGVLGYAHVQHLKAKGLVLDVTSSDAQNFKKLLAGRIDLFSCSFVVGYNLINRLFPPSKAALFTNHPKPLLQEPMYLMISKKIPNGRELAEKFDLGIQKLKASGRYQQIFDTFMGTE